MLFLFALSRNSYNPFKFDFLENEASNGKNCIFSTFIFLYVESFSFVPICILILAHPVYLVITSRLLTYLYWVGN